MGIFARQTNAKVQQDAIVFELETGGVVRKFEISGDGTATELLRAFEQGSETIKAVGKKTQWVPAEGVIALGAGDFDSK